MVRRSTPKKIPRTEDAREKMLEKGANAPALNACGSRGSGIGHTHIQGRSVGWPAQFAPSAARFSLMPERLFITSPFEGFDCTFVWIESPVKEQFGKIR